MRAPRITAPVTRSPNGVVTDKPIAGRFAPEVRAKIVTLAQRENRSASNMVAVLCTEALAARSVQQDQAST